MARPRSLNVAQDAFHSAIENTRDRLPDARRLRAALPGWNRRESGYSQSSVVTVAIGAFALGAIAMAALALRASRPKPLPAQRREALKPSSEGHVTLAPDQAFI